MNHENEHEDTAPDTRRGPLAALAALGLAMLAGTAFTDTATGAWAVLFVVLGLVLLLAAAALWAVDAMQAHGISPDTDDTDTHEGGTDR